MNLVSLFEPTNVFSFFLLLVRISTILLLSPLLTFSNFSSWIKVLVCLTISICFYPLLLEHLHLRSDTVSSAEVIALVTIKESLIGIFIGFLSRAVFFAAQIGAGWISHQMGLDIASFYDPMLGESASLLQSFYERFAYSIFFIFNLHYFYIESILISYQKIPVGSIIFSGQMFWQMLQLFSPIFLIGFKLGAPIAMLIFTINIALGFMARTVPQLNLFTLSYSVTILAGLLLVMMQFNFLAEYVNAIFLQVKDIILNAIAIMS